MKVPPARRAWTRDVATALLLLRLVLGLLFLMTGWHKVFTLGPVAHAERFFLAGYSESWIPDALLWILGVSVPFLELAGGLLLVLGLRVREALLALAALLVMVTYGHLLAEPFFDVTVHVLPRVLLVALLLVFPRNLDWLSLDGLLASRASGRRRHAAAAGSAGADPATDADPATGADPAADGASWPDGSDAQGSAPDGKEQPR